MPPRPTEPDPVLENELERAISPYRGVVSPEVLEQMKERLREALLFHPVGRRLLNRVRPLPALQNSDEIAGRSGPSPADENGQSARRKAGGGTT